MSDTITTVYKCSHFGRIRDRYGFDVAESPHLFTNNIKELSDHQKEVLHCGDRELMRTHLLDIKSDDGRLEGMALVDADIDLERGSVEHFLHTSRERTV